MKPRGHFSMGLAIRRKEGSAAGRRLYEIGRFPAMAGSLVGGGEVTAWSKR